MVDVTVDKVLIFEEKTCTDKDPKDVCNDNGDLKD